MKSLCIFLDDFFKNKGQHVFLSLLVAKICAFLGSLFIIRILPENQFGIISIVASVFAIFAPFSGFGSQQSLLRYGAISQEVGEKKVLSQYLLRKGFFYQLVLSFIFLIISLFYIHKYEEIFVVFLLFAVRLIGFYFFNYIQSELRIFGNNKSFANITNVVNIFGVTFLLIFSYLFGLKGYLIAIAITPFISLFWFNKKHFQSLTETFNFSKKEIWSYGIYASGTALLSDALFSADILMLSFLMNENAVASYKVAILIPANITFLAITFMQSDFPVLAKNFQNKVFLINYIRNYYKIFIPVAAFILMFGFLFKSDVIPFLFSKKYSDESWTFLILLIGFCFNMLLRNLYGNLLSAVGKMKVNTLVSFMTLLLLLLFSVLLVSKYGIEGMAFSLSFSMILSGFMLQYSFYLYLKGLK